MIAFHMSNDCNRNILATYNTHQIIVIPLSDTAECNLMCQCLVPADSMYTLTFPVLCAMSTANPAVALCAVLSGFRHDL
jgi:hypothetical protein